MKVLLSLFSISLLLSPAFFNTQESTRYKKLPDTSTSVEGLVKLHTEDSNTSTIHPSLGITVECEVCFGTGKTCQSEKERCEPDENICLIELTETSKGGKNVSKIGKGCYFSENCTSASIWVTFGQGEFFRKSTLCCSGEDCREDFLPRPPKNMTPNGKRCPACYSELEPCPGRDVECTGSENYCLDMFGLNYSENNITIQGCTTESICKALLSGIVNLFDGNTIFCQPASQGSQLTGGLFLSLAAYLLTNVLL
ncbi:phospholipase A2 inhibitor and Ly6/PLAUR domain-containing protein-like [Erythrolamprus reginae]|uniref:phospholipase A2 inhibitor and Ly6/PLAUR domain-containing protein-like n=1 Tax=Erythrolamprus reginae TaxID=121349 RepID=UPI00396C73EA